MMQGWETYGLNYGLNWARKWLN